MMVCLLSLFYIYRLKWSTPKAFTTTYSLEIRQPNGDIFYGQNYNTKKNPRSYRKLKQIYTSKAKLNGVRTGYKQYFR